MIKFNGQRIPYKPGSLRQVGSKDLKVHHYIGLNLSTKFDSGIQAKQITIDVVARNISEKHVIEALMQDSEERILELFGVYYERVVSGPTWSLTPQDAIGELWEGTMTFICLDPVPRVTGTGARVY